MSTSPFLPAEDPRAGSCGSCGAPMATDQRYCLSCGARRQHARLPFQDVGAPSGPVQQMGVSPALWAPPGGTSSGPQTSTLLAALACVLLAFGVGVLVGGDGDGGSQQPIVLGGAPAASAAAPTPTTTTEATASAEDPAAEEEVDASSEKTQKIDKAGLNAEEKEEATELEKVPAAVPKAKKIDDQTKKDLESDDPDKAREASQNLPDAVSTGE
ncbi:unannotated protein [freshwater metagenome]|uniref:Unannotated protein n=1 Tax=freshwater metagenome TaxID=449393 RepID=A0A6J7KDL4_9ZZZZ|nr:hypothetical protein [Actinomycetota bacterium]